MKRQNLNPARLERLREEAEGEAEELLDAQVTENGINLLISLAKAMHPRSLLCQASFCHGAEAE